MAKTFMEIERKTSITSTFNPHRNSYYN
jgi:hypothetical protein